VNKPFTDFDEEIKLTSTQRQDAKTKYENVCGTLCKKYYDSSYDESKKLLFGSYKLHTNIRPLTSDQDVDVLFKIPKEVYDRISANESNGQSALLDEIRRTLKVKYSTTDKIKAWGKVVLVQFKDGSHNVELLPAYEREDGTFEIPNTENGGSWESFDPRSRITAIDQSYKNTSGYTKKLIRAVKRWRNNTVSISLKSYRIEELVLAFVEAVAFTHLDLSERMLEFFKFIQYKVDESDRSNVDTAISRAEKAIDYEEQRRLRKASEEWRKIFGNEFSLLDDSKEESSTQNDREIHNPHRPWIRLR